jgi:hypothetical protein
MCVNKRVLFIQHTHYACLRNEFATRLLYDNHNFAQVPNSYDGVEEGGRIWIGLRSFCSSATLIIYHGRHQPFSNKPVKTRGVRRVCPHLERSNICLHLLALCYDLSGTPGTGFAWDMGLTVFLGTGYTVIMFLRVLQMFIANPHLSLSPSRSFRRTGVRETKGAQKNSLNIYV